MEGELPILNIPQKRQYGHNGRAVLKLSGVISCGYRTGKRKPTSRFLESETGSTGTTSLSDETMTSARVDDKHLYLSLIVANAIKARLQVARPF